MYRSYEQASALTHAGRRRAGAGAADEAEIT
jgi:hypothetical protein